MAAQRCSTCGKMVWLWWLHRHLPKAPPGRRPGRAGRVTPDGHGGYQVIRHGQAVPYMIGLVRKSEGYKLLYALANGWDSVTVETLHGVRVVELWVSKGASDVRGD